MQSPRLGDTLWRRPSWVPIPPPARICQYMRIPDRICRKDRIDCHERMTKEACKSLLRHLTVESNSTANEVSQRGFVDLVIFVEVDRPCLLGLEPAVEELVRIWKTCALKKVHFHTSLESTQSQYKSIMDEHCSVPFPILSDLWHGIVNDLAELGQRFAAPIGEGRNLLVDKFGRVHRHHSLTFNYMNADAHLLEAEAKGSNLSALGRMTRTDRVEVGLPLSSSYHCSRIIFRFLVECWTIFCMFLLIMIGSMILPRIE